MAIDEKVLIERLEKKRNASDTKFNNIIEMNAYDDGVDDSIQIVKDLAEEHKELFGNSEQHMEAADNEQI